jgi:hypothetical protein
MSAYEERVIELEELGCTTSDAQSVADCEVLDGKLAPPGDELEALLDGSWKKLEKLEAALSRQLWEQGAARRVLGERFEKEHAEYQRLRAIVKSSL